MDIFLNAFFQVIVHKLVDKVTGEVISILGVERKMENLLRNLENIRPLLAEAESKKFDDKPFNHWLGRLRELMYDVEDLLDDFHAQADKIAASRETSRRARIKARLQSVPGFSHMFSVVFRHNLRSRINDINLALEKLLCSDVQSLQLMGSHPNADKKVFRYTSSRKIDTCPIQLDSDIVGIDDDAAKLADQITEDNTRTHSVFAITGIPGIGKTTLARKIFNHGLVQNHFDITVWICVSRDCHGQYLLKETVRFNKKKYNEEEMYTGDNEGRVSLNTLYSKVIEVVKGRRVFIVLDDIWDACVWEEFFRVPICTGAENSRILITTRNQNVARQMNAVHIHQMTSMSQRHGWLMLFRTVFEEEEEEEQSKMNELEKVGMRIVNKCEGLPLVIKVVGGVLRTTDRTPDAWEGVHSSGTWSMQDLPENVLPGLLLSYEDLPSYLKQCFVYFSLFPNDFEFDRSTLTYMWIAEGFMKTVEKKEMEEFARDCYNELVMRNIIQVLPEYYDGRRCKMHDLLRSLALYVSQTQYIYIDPEKIPSTSSIRPRHLSFVGKKMDATLEISQHDRVRTLLLSRKPQINMISSELLSRLTRLRVLDLEDTGIETLPNSLGALICLRFLNISHTKLRVLPNSIKNLKDLETLKACGLKYLHSLPDGIVELVNLRWLHVADTENHLHNMPVGFDSLKNLRILYGFVANDGTTSEGYQYASNMKELRNLCELTDLSIYKLERISTRAEAEEATLDNKTKLRFLRLSCSYRIETDPPTTEEIEKIEKVFARIRTPKSLRALVIDGFFGKELPSHMTSDSLCNVTWLRLDDCKLVRRLPSLGDMPRLETLEILSATSIVEFDSGFVGSLKFPKLKDLFLRRMTKLERMFKVEQGAFPCLKKLRITKCPKLKSLSDGLQHATCLKQLTIEDAENLEVVRNQSSICELTLKGNSRLRYVENLLLLDIMNITNCSALEDVKGMGSLSYLFISDANMKTLPQWLNNIFALKKLNVIGNTGLVPRTYENAEDWNLIKTCLCVEVRSRDRSKYMSYRKEPYSYNCDLT